MNTDARLRGQTRIEHFCCCSIRVQPRKSVFNALEPRGHADQEARYLSPMKRTILCTLLAALAAPAAADRLSDDEVVLFVPSTAHADGTDKVDVRVEAWVYELENRPLS